MNEAARKELVGALSDALTEDRTDKLIDWLAGKLPFWARPVVKMVLDKLFPDLLIEGLEEALK